MNVIYLSPHFPPNYHLFCVALRRLGATVLGLSDEPYDLLRPQLKDALNEYYRVSNMHNYNELLRAGGYFIHHYGRIDWLDSHNEYWLETEAQLRTDFNIEGLKNNDIAIIKHKSKMKELFKVAKVAAARGKVVDYLEQARELIHEIGYPVVVKPDIGVGASRTYKIHNDDELKSFWNSKPEVDYMMEEFVNGTVCSFDGLTDRDGDLVFYTSHVFSRGIMETVNEDNDMYYYSLREIPPDLEKAGMSLVRTFRVKGRFFHFEFFRTPENRLVALEVNMRPPGGLTTDMFNYANDIDIYQQWANIVVNNRFETEYSRPYHCCYIGRKSNISYAHTYDEILDRYQSIIVQKEPISGIFRGALGDYGFLVRSPDLDEVLDSAHFIQQRQGNGA